MIRAEAIAGGGIRAILRKLEQDFPDRVPTERTVGDIVREVRPPDQSKPWLAEDADPNEAAVILPVVGAVLEHSAGEVRAITNAEAEWIYLIRTIAAVDDDLWDAYRLARLAVSGFRDDVICYLALTPWLDNGERYLRAVERGLVESSIYLRYETPGEALGIVKPRGRPAEGDRR